MAIVGSGGGAAAAVACSQLAVVELRRPINLEVSTGNDRAAHYLKEIRRYLSHRNSLGRSVRTWKGRAKRIDCSEILEVILCAIAQVEKVDIRKRKVFDVSFLHVTAREDQAFWILVWKLSQQHTVGNTKNRRAGAHGKGDSDDRGDSKNGVLAQRAKRI
jgi:hypothetical protein